MTREPVDLSPIGYAAVFLGFMAMVAVGEWSDKRCIVDAARSCTEVECFKAAAEVCR